MATSLRRRARELARCAAIAFLVLAFALSCSESGEPPPVTTVPPRPGGLGRLGTQPPSTGPNATGSTSAGGTATITRFETPPAIVCTRDQPTNVSVAYATDAARVAFLVDNVEAALPSPALPSGTVDISVTCDGAIHTVVLVAVDAAGRTSLDSRAVAVGDS